MAVIVLQFQVHRKLVLWGVCVTLFSTVGFFTSTLGHRHNTDHSRAWVSPSHKSSTQIVRSLDSSLSTSGDPPTPIVPFNYPLVRSAWRHADQSLKYLPRTNCSGTKFDPIMLDGITDEAEMNTKCEEYCELNELCEGYALDAGGQCRLMISICTAEFTRPSTCAPHFVSDTSCVIRRGDILCLILILILIVVVNF
jgi:hypothetical protein